MLVPNASRVTLAKCGDDPRKVFGLQAQNNDHTTHLAWEIQCWRAVRIASRFRLPPAIAHAVAEFHLVEAAP
jgi:hypothetical protein